MKKKLFICCASLIVLVSFPLFANLQSISKQTGTFNNESNSEWKKYGLVNYLSCFGEPGESYFFSCEVKEQVVFYRVINGVTQYSLNSSGSKRLIKNPYSKIRVKTKYSENSFTKDVSHYTWCYEFSSDNFELVEFFHEL